MWDNSLPQTPLSTAHAAPDEKAHAWLEVMAPDLDAATLRRLASLFELTHVGPFRIRGTVPANKRGQERDAAPVFVAHATTMHGLEGFCCNRQVMGSETLKKTQGFGESLRRGHHETVQVSGQSLGLA